MFSKKPLLFAAVLASFLALASFSAQAFWGPFNVMRGWGDGPWYGYPYYGYPYYGYPYYGGWGHPYHGGWGHPYHGGWGSPYGWGAPYVAYPDVAAPASRAPVAPSESSGDY